MKTIKLLLFSLLTSHSSVDSEPCLTVGAAMDDVFAAVDTEGDEAATQPAADKAKASCSNPC